MQLMLPSTTSRELFTLRESRRGDHELCEHGSDRRETSAKRVSDDLQLSIFWRRQICFRKMFRDLFSVFRDFQLVISRKWAPISKIGLYTFFCLGLSKKFTHKDPATCNPVKSLRVLKNRHFPNFSVKKKNVWKKKKTFKGSQKAIRNEGKRPHIAFSIPLAIFSSSWRHEDHKKGHFFH